MQETEALGHGWRGKGGWHRRVGTVRGLTYSLRYCFTASELPANILFQFLLLLDFFKAHFYVFPLTIYVILEAEMHEAQS